MAFLHHAERHSGNAYHRAWIPAKDWSREGLTLAVFGSCLAFWGLFFFVVEAFFLRP